LKKFKTAYEAVQVIEDGMTLMIGGFLGVGTPETLISALIEKGSKDLTVICNDTGFPDRGIGRLVVAGMVKRVYTSHIGTNPESGQRMNDGRMEVILTPQGTLAEQVRAAGAGLGGVITPTGLGTVVEEGKQTITIDGVRFLVEKPLHADIALISAETVDVKGNCVYDKAACNFNPLMAMAAKHTIVEAHEVVAAGEIDPNAVRTPHIFVHVIVKEEA
jgi:acetate CoA/acetoacetate CoA-transferase alpha subunit